MGYRLSRKAEDDIIDLYLSGAVAFGPTKAREYHLGLGKIFEFLSDHPYAAREREEIKPPVRVHRYVSHIVIYVVDEKGDVLILRVRHGAEDWQTDPV